jgi:hypothetical protein
MARRQGAGFGRVHYLADARHIAWSQPPEAEPKRFRHAVRGLLKWSTAKEGRRTNAKPEPQRRATFGERIARIQLPDGHFVEGLSRSIAFCSMASHQVQSPRSTSNSSSLPAESSE